MMNPILLFIVLVFFSSKDSPEESNQLQTFEVLEFQEKWVPEQEPKRQYCFAKEIFKKKGTYYLIADYIEFLTDDEAIEKAKEQYMADYNITKEGDTVYSVFNHYYVSNVNPKLRTLKLSDTVKMLDY